MKRKKEKTVVMRVPAKLASVIKAEKARTKRRIEAKIKKSLIKRKRK